MDALIARARKLLGPTDYRIVFDAGLSWCLADIRNDLLGFGVVHDTFFSERSLTTDGYVQHAVDRLREQGHLFEQDGALWFRATTFGDDKDRVLVRENGAATYFASDIGYLLSKFERGFERALYVLGADHHGYIARLKAAAQGLGLDPAKIEIQLVQFAILYRGQERVQMSTRAGSFVTLRELREEVGTDAARFFYVMRSNDQHLDFDLELAKSHSNDNPVYYIQYAHARIASLFRQLKDKQLAYNDSAAVSARKLLTSEAEDVLLVRVDALPGNGRVGRGRTRAAGDGQLPARDRRRLPCLLQRAADPERRGSAATGAARPVQGDPAGAGQWPGPARRVRAGDDVMARRGKNQARRSGRSGGTPGWVWLLAGLLIGALAYGYVQYKGKWSGPDSSLPQPDPQARAQAASGEEVVPPPVEKPKPKYEFYTLLPEKEVVIPDAELDAQARAEAAKPAAPVARRRRPMPMPAPVLRRMSRRRRSRRPRPMARAT